MCFVHARTQSSIDQDSHRMPSRVARVASVLSPTPPNSQFTRRRLSLFNAISAPTERPHTIRLLCPPFTPQVLDSRSHIDTRAVLCRRKHLREHNHNLQPPPPSPTQRSASETHTTTWPLVCVLDDLASCAKCVKSDQSYALHVYRITFPYAHTNTHGPLDLWHTSQHTPRKKTTYPIMCICLRLSVWVCFFLLGTFNVVRRRNAYCVRLGRQR